jgi:hypothetical protein
VTGQLHSLPPARASGSGMNTAAWPEPGQLRGALTLAGEDAGAGDERR